MQQVEFNIPANVWAGLNTKYDPLTKRVMPDEFTAGSHNYDISPTGNVTKRAKTNVYNPSALAHPIKDEYEMIFESGTRHKLVMSNGELFYTLGDGIFHSVHSGYVAAGNMEFASQDNRVYFGNGIDNPQVYDMGTSYGGVAYTPPTVADAGVKAPSTGLVAGSPTAGGAVPDGAHTYKYTFLYYDSQESNGSVVSGVQTCGAGNNTVPLTSIDVGGLGVTARKIYRDDNDGNWVLVHTIPNNTATTYSDVSALGTTPIPQDNNMPPLWALVTQFRDRLWVAGVAAFQSTLYYSDAGLPDVWPTNNFIGCNSRDVITGVTSFNDKVVVFGKSSFGIILGSTSDDFRYVDISPNIGCVDNRSIQIVTVQGVPKLQWLSQFGIYQWDGSNIELISDKIENLLRFNIQQSQGSFNRNIQNTIDDFLAGTATPGINLVTFTGSITTRGYMKAGDTDSLLIDPTKQWDTQEEWEGGTSSINLVTLDGTNTSKQVFDYVPTIAASTLSGLQFNAGPANVSIPVVANVTGENHISGGGSKNSEPTQNSSKWAQPIVFPRAGVINSFSVNIGGGAIGGITNRVVIYSDSSGTPGGILFNTSFVSGSDTITATPNLAVAAGRYWIGADQNHSTPTQFTQINCRTDLQFTLANGANPLQNLGGGWTGFNASAFTGGGVCQALKMSFTFTQTAVPASGTMTTPVYDSLSLTAQTPTASQVVVVPASTRAITVVQGADNVGMSTNLVTFTMDSDVIGTGFSQTAAISNKRFWRMITTLSTTDDRSSPTAQGCSLLFGSATWISEVIDHTTDIISLDDLLVSSTVPANTGLTVTIATSTDNVTYSAFTVVGLATPRRYSKVKAIFVRSLGNVTATLSFLRLNWSLTSTFTSYGINTVLTPVQWGTFQADYETNSGTVVFQTRSATTQGGLTAASWTTVLNGDIIPSALNLWVQWRVTITSHVSQVPEIRSVVVNWLTVTNTGIRVASCFYDQTYYIAAAEFNSLTNNIVLYYDREGRWGQYTNLTINTMGLFFGQAYYGDALVGNYVQWLNPTITSTQAIEVDIRSKAYSSELISDDKTKALRHLIVECDDSLATITPYYSVDNGETWEGMVDVVTGFNAFTGAGTTKHRKIRFVPTSQTIQWGYSVIVRLFNNDQYPLNIVGMRAKVMVSDRPVLLR